MLQQEDLLNSRGANVFDREGNKIGSIEDIYLDRETDQPEWAVVKTGLLGTRVNFVPLRDASSEEDDLRVPYDKDQVAGAPNVDEDGELSQQEEAELYGYYGLEYSEYKSDTGLPEGDRAGEYESSDRGTDDAMTRSEEELEVGKSRREAGVARLKKYVVTENVTRTVPVQREEVRVEREPVSDANLDESTSGPDITESEHEVTLHEEEPVVEKRVVPKERVRLSKDTTTEEREISEDVRKEEIDAEGNVRS